MGVIAGIAFLALELNQSNEALAVQARLDREEIIRQAVRRRLETPGVITAVTKSNRGEELTDEEILVLNWTNHAVMIDWMLVHEQVQDGVLEEAAIPLELWRFAFHETYPRMSESWTANKPSYTPAFIEWMEENVIDSRQ